MSDKWQKLVDEAKLNAHESRISDGEMSTEELEKIFKEPIPDDKIQILEVVTAEDAKKWEEEQNNSNDIYKIAARIKNIAGGGKLSLTPAGEGLCNTFAHMLKTMYNFAETLKDEQEKGSLNKLIREQEQTPGNFIGAMMAGVKRSKKNG